MYHSVIGTPERGYDEKAAADCAHSHCSHAPLAEKCFFTGEAGEKTDEILFAPAGANSARLFV